MKRSGFKRKAALTPAQRQIREETRQWKQEQRTFGAKRQSSTGARGGYWKGEWIPSQWQLKCLQELEIRERIGEITGLESQTDIEYTIFNECGKQMVCKINVDFCFFDKNINRPCRWDAKPPKVVHRKSGRVYPQKLHALWKFKFEQLQFCQPDYDYRILEQGNCWRDLDLNMVRD